MADDGGVSQPPSPGASPGPRPGLRIALVAPGGVDTPIYDQSATALGRRNRPPFPVASAEDAARWRPSRAA